MEPHRMKVSRDDNEDDMLKPCFKIGSHVRLREVPTTGEEYLLKVMKERKNYAVITTCTRDVSVFAKNQNRFIEEIPIATTCDKLKPTIEWQEIQVADFSKIRDNVCKLRTNVKKYMDRIHKLEREPMDVTEWNQLFQSTDPTLSVILGFHNALVDAALENVTCILHEVKPGHTIDYRTGVWIYALLANVVQPTPSDSLCILRDLARACAEVRSNIDPEAENALEAVIPMNIFICIVVQYFRQFDLGDGSPNLYDFVYS